MPTTYSKRCSVGMVATLVVAGLLTVGAPLSAQAVGITSDTGNSGDTPSTTTPSNIYTGFSTETIQPQIVSITTNSGLTLSPDGNTNFPAGYNGAPLTFFVLFDEDMITSSQSIFTPEGLALGDAAFTCTDSSVAVDGQTFKYSTGSARILELPLTDLLPATGTCQLLLNRGDYDINSEFGSTGTIRDVAHNPTPIALYTISSTCALNDTFIGNSIGCWSQQNSGNGSFSISGGVLNYSSTAGSVTGSSAPALRKTGINLSEGATTFSVALTVNSVSLQTGDGIGLRFTDQNSNTVMLLVYNDGTNTFYQTIGSNGTVTHMDTDPMISAPMPSPYDPTSNKTMTLSIVGIGVVPPYTCSRNSANNQDCSISWSDLTWNGGEFGTSNLTIDIVGIRGSSGGTASAVLDSFIVN